MGSVIEGDFLNESSKLEYINNRNKKRCKFQDEMLEQTERTYPNSNCVIHKKCNLGQHYTNIIDSKSVYSGFSKPFRYFI